MKNILCLLSLVLLAACTQNHEDKKQAGTKNGQTQAPELRATLGGTGFVNDTTHVIYIAATLHNPTPDTLHFLSMSCAYEDVFTTNKDSFLVQPRNICFKNVPTVVSLAPGASTNRYFVIATPWINPAIRNTIRGISHDHLLRSTFKLGMYYIPVNKNEPFEKAMQKKMQLKDQPVLWSNTIDLKKLGSDFIYEEKE